LRGKEHKRIVFVCTGNVCRSPMAEYLLRHHLRGDAAFQVDSAGLFAISGLPASPAAVAVLREQGINLAPHRSRPLSKEMVDGADWIVVMTAGHANEVVARHADAAGKVRLLTSFGRQAGSGRDISDPIGCSVATYRAIRDEIDAALLDLILFLKKGSK